MRVLCAGHRYELDHLDGSGHSELVFVKRIGDKYPGNGVDPHEGTNIQEVLRALINRVEYLNSQDRHPTNVVVLSCLRQSILSLEQRAAERHGRILKRTDENGIEYDATCHICGHIECQQHGH